MPAVRPAPRRPAAAPLFRPLSTSLLCAALAAGAGCGRAPDPGGASAAPTAAAQTAVTPAAAAPPRAAAPAPPGRVVDSILPMPELLRRFRADLGPAPAALGGGAPSREALVRAFVRAVEARDTAALRRLVLSRAEFAYLYFPESPVSRPPYSAPPALAWFQLVEGSNKGGGRLLARLGGRPLGYAGHRCEGPGERQGANRVWARCTVRLARAAGDTAERRLFGSVVARGGRYKFASYANDF
jgi:hypothetical protein